MIGILLVALALRLLHVVPLDHAEVYSNKGGDSWWYLEYGAGLVRNQEPAVPPSGPIYLLFVGLPQLITTPETAILLIRLAQAVLGTITCYLVYRLATTISKDIRAGLISAAVLAVSPAFIIETGQVLTETLFVFLLASSLWLYVRLIERTPATFALTRRAYLWAAIVGGVVGIATLTRAVILAFPLGLAIHLVMVYGWRRGLRLGLVLVVAFAVTLSPWTIYNRVKWGQTVIAAQGFAAFVFLGASNSGWQGPQQTDNSLQQQSGTPLPTDPGEQQRVYSQGAANAILSDVGGWAKSRIYQLGNAILQPHGTVFFAGESLKDMTSRWLKTDRSLGGLIRLTQGDYFWPKLAIYVFHGIGILAGLVGLWISRRNWQLALPLAGVIGYVLLAHFVLYVIPRYLFPLDMVWWVFGGIAFSTLWRQVASGNGRRSPVATR